MARPECIGRITYVNVQSGIPRQAYEPGLEGPNLEVVEGLAMPRPYEVAAWIDFRCHGDSCDYGHTYGSTGRLCGDTYVNVSGRKIGEFRAVSELMSQAALTKHEIKAINKWSRPLCRVDSPHQSIPTARTDVIRGLLAKLPLTLAHEMHPDVKQRVDMLTEQLVALGLISVDKPASTD